MIQILCSATTITNTNINIKQQDFPERWLLFAELLRSANCTRHLPLTAKTMHVSYHVSRLLNFFVTTFPKSMPNRSTILWARSGCDVPLKTLIFGILLLRNELGFSKFARIKLFARTGSDTTGITAKTSHTTNQITAEKDLHHILINVF